MNSEEKSEVFLGIDLAGSQRRSTGICLLKNCLAITSTAKEDEEIIAVARASLPRVIAIDAPLSKPRKGFLRAIERGLLKRGIRFFPPLKPKGMAMLTNRAIALKNKLAKIAMIIETYPGAALDIAKVKRNDVKEIVDFLKRRGIKMSIPKSKDEVDACVCAWIAREFSKGRTEKLGTKKDWLVLPRI